MRKCKSPAHERYGKAMENLYIQAHLASLDLIEVLNEARIENPPEAWRALVMKQHKLDIVSERLAFGRTELERATREVNAHFTRGCVLVPKEEA